jgi:hypothetical protein
MNTVSSAPEHNRYMSLLEYQSLYNMFRLHTQATEGFQCALIFRLIKPSQTPESAQELVNKIFYTLFGYITT